jgi:PAS domain S-box-containing protein
MCRDERTASQNEPDPGRTIIDQIPVLAWTARPDGSVDFVNRRWLDYTGRSEADALDWAWTSAIHPGDLGPLLDQWKAQLVTGDPGEFEARMRRHDGEYRWFLIRCDSQRDGFGKILKWYGANTEIEDRRRAEEALRRAQARLARATHHAEMSELSALIAHEISQPLSAVLANGPACQRWLDAEPPNVGRARLSAERIIRDGKSAAQIVRRIRALIRYATPQKSFANPNEVINAVRIATK